MSGIILSFVEHFESLDVLLHPFISFKQKAARTEVQRRKENRKELREKVHRWQSPDLRIW